MDLVPILTAGRCTAAVMNASELVVRLEIGRQPSILPLIVQTLHEAFRYRV